MVLFFFGHTHLCRLNMKRVFNDLGMEHHGTGRAGNKSTAHLDQCETETDSNLPHKLLARYLKWISPIKTNWPNF